MKGPPNDIYCIIEEPYKHYFTEKVSYSRDNYSLCLQDLKVYFREIFNKNYICLFDYLFISS
ncbi:hypothetical protein M3J57_30035, partial [Klebsiella pneumoniae]|nr:hypothetical protein [Klebsiella pneumoniae]